LSAGFTASLGPLQAAVDRIGLNVTTTFPSHGGNLGPANLALAFKPPNGIGLSVDAGIVSGGGYLYIDTARGECAGAMQLMFADFLSLGAIGLIDTKLPDGSSGFSLLIIITADFGAGIQLGFGFTLNAVTDAVQSVPGIDPGRASYQTAVETAARRGPGIADLRPFRPATPPCPGTKHQ
jgi:hypothetical protein